MSRYDQLLELIDKVKPQSIVEVGVARAVRAEEMVLRALAHSPHVSYTGYDVFRSVDSKFYEDAYNHKRVDSVNRCSEKLARLARLNPGRFDYAFVVGDTRTTLHGRKIIADFAFIDGDHRTEVIDGDYAALDECKVVVFDDYYFPDERGIPDTTKLGANRTVDKLTNAEILPGGDAGKFCGISRLAVVRK